MQLSHMIQYYKVLSNCNTWAYTTTFSDKNAAPMHLEIADVDRLHVLIAITEEF